MILGAASQLPLAHASVVLSYDNGSLGGSLSDSTGNSAGVRFSLQSGWTGAKLLTARYDFDPGCSEVHSFTVLVLDSDHTTALTASFSATPSSGGFFDVDLSSLNIIVTHDFFIGIQWQANGVPCLGIDTGPSTGRSYDGASPATWIAYSGNFIIRAVVDPITPVIPEYPNGLPLLVGFMLIAFAVIRRRTRNNLP